MSYIYINAPTYILQRRKMVRGVVSGWKNKKCSSSSPFSVDTQSERWWRDGARFTYGICIFIITYISRRKSFPFHTLGRSSRGFYMMKCSLLQWKIWMRTRKSNVGIRRTTQSSVERWRLRGLQKVSILKCLQMKNFKVEKYRKIFIVTEKSTICTRNERVQNE